LVVQLRRRDGSSVHRAKISVAPIAAGDRERTAMDVELGGTSIGYPAGVSGEFEAEDGRFVVDGLSVGRHTVTIHPEGSGGWIVRADADATADRYLSIQDEVVLAAGRASERSYEVQLGGWLKISARDAEGEFVAASCELFDASGASVPVFFLSRSAGSIRVGPDLPGDAPALLRRLLVPGTYRLSVTAEGVGSRDIDVRVEPDRTTSVDVVLDGR